MVTEQPFHVWDNDPNESLVELHEAYEAEYERSKPHLLELNTQKQALLLEIKVLSKISEKAKAKNQIKKAKELKGFITQKQKALVHIDAKLHKFSHQVAATEKTLDTMEFALYGTPFLWGETGQLPREAFNIPYDFSGQIWQYEPTLFSDDLPIQFEPVSASDTATETDEALPQFSLQTAAGWGKQATYEADEPTVHFGE